MEDGGSRSHDDDWLLEPPEAGRLHFAITTGSEVELTPEARAALDLLVSHLQTDEVTGFAMSEPCGSLDACSKYRCNLGKCMIYKAPCLADVVCYINPCPYKAS